jgi:hypothetical protein
MRSNTFGRLPFNTDNRSLPEMPWTASAEPPSLRLPEAKPRPVVSGGFSARRRGAGAAFLQRLRIKRLP